MAGPSITTFMQWAIKNSAGTLPATQLIDNVTGRIGASQEIVDSNGQNASLTGRTNRMRVTGLPVEPTFSFEPTAIEWTYLLPILLGGSSAGTTPIVYTPGNDLPLFSAQGVEDRGGTPFYHNYTNLSVDSWTIRSSPGGLLGLDISCVGTGYENTTVFPTLTNFDNVYSPFCFPDLTGDGTTGLDGLFTINSVTRLAFSISLTCNYGLDRGRRPHTLAVQGLRKRMRDINVQFQMQADDAQNIYSTDLRGLTPYAVLMRWRNPVQTTEYIEIDLPSVIFPLPDIDLPRRDEIRPTVSGIAKYDGTNSPILVKVQLRT